MIQGPGAADSQNESGQISHPNQRSIFRSEALRHYRESQNRIEFPRLAAPYALYTLWIIAATLIVIGTAIGLFFSYLLQEIGLDVSAMMQGATMMMSNVLRARVTPPSAIVGFIPGLVGTVLGTMIAGIGIFKRQTARLFKELEA